MLCAGADVRAQQKVTVPTVPPSDAPPISFRDSRYGVRFQVPPGWNFTRKDREVSTFRLDARTAPPASDLRGVASIGFNPYPRSVLSGALVYFSVAKHTNDRACAAEATAPLVSADEGVGEEHSPGGGPQKSDPPSGGASAAGPGNDQTPAPPSMDLPGVDVPSLDLPSLDLQSIGGMGFLHGHDEHGGMCVEGRDEVYTAYHKGSCYRFDLTVNTFCAVSSGAMELSIRQMRNLEAQMTGILSTVALDWEKTGPQPVPVPEIVPGRPKSPRRPLPTAPGGHKQALGLGE